MDIFLKQTTKQENQRLQYSATSPLKWLAYMEQICFFHSLQAWIKKAEEV